MYNLSQCFVVLTYALLLLYDCCTTALLQVQGFLLYYCFTTGAASKFFAVLLTFPAQTIKLRMQVCFKSS